MDSSTLIAITGGIGSGKSTAARIVAAMGIPVYDCDSRAKALMDADPEIKRRIASEISADCITAGNTIDRSRLAARAFSDPDCLATLNGIVHDAVRRDIVSWVARHAERPLLCVETAILYESRLDEMVSAVLLVDAPKELRIARVMARSAMTREQVEERITAQQAHNPGRRHPRVTVALNDGISPLLPQVEDFIASL